MSEIKWIKITTDMFEDEKIDFIESLPECDTILVVWVKLLTLSGKINMSGHIFLTENIPYTEEMLAHKLKRPISSVRMALEVFQRLGMIEHDGAFMISNWEKHQNADMLNKIREDTRNRVQKHRDKQKLLPSAQEKKECNVTDALHVTQSNALRSKKEEVRQKTKVHYAEFVSMTEDEYNKLVEKHGEEFTKRCIEVLDNYKGQEGKKYKSDYRAMLNWVTARVVADECKKNPFQNPNQPQPSNIYNPNMPESVRRRLEGTKVQ